MWCLGFFGSSTELGWSTVFFSEILNLLLLRLPLKLIGLFAKTFWWKSSSKIETSSWESASSPSASSASVSLSSLFLPVLLPWELLREVLDSTLKKNKKLFFQYYILTKFSRNLFSLFVLCIILYIKKKRIACKIDEFVDDLFLLIFYQWGKSITTGRLEIQNYFSFYQHKHCMRCILTKFSSSFFVHQQNNNQSKNSWKCWWFVA